MNKLYKIKNRAITVSIVLFTIIFFISCSDSNSSSSDKTTSHTITSLKYLNVDDAKALLISSDSIKTAPKRSYSDIGDISQILSKLDGNENILEVEPSTEEVSIELNDNADYESYISFDDMYPYYSENINSEYLVVLYTTTETADMPIKSFIIRKSDGFAFDLEKNIPYYKSTANPNHKVMQSDDNGNFYTILQTGSAGNDGVVYKINIVSDSITKEIYSLDGDVVSNFNVDSYGNLAYNGTDKNNNSIVKYLKATGEELSLPGSNGTQRVFYNDFDGNMNMHMPYENIEGTDTKRINGLDYTISDYGTASIGTFENSASILYMENKGSVMAIFGSIYEIVNEESEPRNLEITSKFNLSSITLSSASKNYYYISGLNDEYKTVLLKIDPNNDSYTTLINGEYDLSSMSVSKNDSVSFNALRNSDAQNVIGSISADGIIKVIQAISSSTDISSLESLE